MSTVRGLAGGVLALSLLQAVTSNSSAAGNLGGLFTLATGAIRRLVDPSVPLIPDHRKPTG